MPVIITVDGGTTNTRVTLFRDGAEVGREKLAIGAGKTAETGDNSALCAAISGAISRLLTEYTPAGTRPERILASGMLTSELGLCELPHLTAPVGIPELKAGRKTVEIPGIPFGAITFIPGVKNAAGEGTEAVYTADMMRGEETELYGLASQMNLVAPFTAVLPGSHTKVIRVDKTGAITGCRTTLGGELLSAIPRNTILRASVPSPLLSPDADPAYLTLGYRCALSLGANAAFFRARVLDRQMHASPADCGAFLAGAILSSDITAIAALAGEDPVLLGGSRPLRSAFAALLRENLPNRVIEADDAAAESAVANGARLISGCL